MDWPHLPASEGRPICKGVFRDTRITMLDTQKEESSTVIMVVLALLVLIMIVWGWMRAHAQTDMNPIHQPPPGKTFGGAASVE
jgi:SNF family Na+-dependent transporter